MQPGRLVGEDSCNVVPTAWHMRMVQVEDVKPAQGQHITRRLWQSMSHSSRPSRGAAARKARSSSLPTDSDGDVAMSGGSARGSGRSRKRARKACAMFVHACAQLLAIEC